MIATKDSKACLGGFLGLLCVALTLSAGAQVKTTTTEEFGQPTQQVTVESGEIVFINGNSVVVKMANGELRHFDNVPDSTTFLVDGKPVNIHNARVGMRLQKQTITTTIPKVVRTVETVSGTVWQAMPPTTVILTLENGQNQRFTIPKGQKFVVDGKETDAFGLRKGNKVQAQRITEVPATVVAEEIRRTGTAPPPPPEPQPNIPILIVVSAPAPAPVQVAAAEAIPARLPQTASDLPLIGLSGMLLCGLSLTTMLIRKFWKRSRSSQAGF